MIGLFVLSAVLAAPDAGVPAHTPGRAPTHPSDAGVSARAGSPAAHAPDAGTPARSADAGVPRSETQRTGTDGGTAARDNGARPNAADGAPQPATHVSVQEPATPDAGTSRLKKARADRTDGQGDPQMDALLEQSRAQTQALQQISSQQQAAEDRRIAEQQAQAQRAAQIDGARGSIDSTVQSLQANGNWNASSLQSTRMSLQQTAAAASAAGSPAEASRVTEAARLIGAAEAALAQKNAQQAQYYLLQANQLLQGGQNVRY